MKVVKGAALCVMMACVPVVHAQVAMESATQTEQEVGGAFRVSDIRVNGLQRISSSTVFAALPLNVGDYFGAEQSQAASRALFKTGYFDDITFGRDGNVLLIQVVERPTIAEINFDGNKAIKNEDLADALKKNGLAEGEIFKPSTLDGVSGEMERQYVSQGRYGAKVDVETYELPRNRVGIKINIKEGSVTNIEHINIVGNEAFTDKELLDLFELEESGLFSFVNKRNKYSREKLTSDIEKLRSHYLDRGYLRFNVDSTQVALSEDKSAVFITINISEGDVYTVSGTEFAGQLIVPEAEMRELVSLKDGETFSQLELTNTTKRISDRLGNDGYTFADVRSMPERNDADKTVKITLFVNPGQRAYVRRINFRGNTRTADEVLRREMRQMESASANASKIEQSKVRLERLGYFKDVKVNNTEVPGTGDQMDVEYIVAEQPSGSIGASIGFAQGSGMILGANLQQDNFLGTGKQVGINASTSSYQDQISFSYFDPYYTVDGVSRGFNVYYSTRDLEEVNISDYSVDSYGIDMNFGYPLSEISRLGWGIGYAHNKIKIGSDPAQEISGTPTYPLSYFGYVDAADVNICNGSAAGACTIQPWTDSMLSPVNTVHQGFLDRHGNSFDDIRMTASWSRSTLNRGRLPDRGYSQSISGEMTLPGVSDLEYWKINMRTQHFFPINDDLTLRLRGRVGFGDGYGGTDELPFFESFYGGGFGSVRGFKRNTLGPRGTPSRNYAMMITKNGQYAYVADANGKLKNGYGWYSDDDAIGGNIIIDGTAEILFPVPFVKDQSSMQATLFLDAGNVFSTNCSKVYGVDQVNCGDVDFGDLRYSVGIGLTWITGFGPLTFSLGKGLNASSDDETEVFQFSMGQSF